jgi:hypothetical protein
MLALGRFLFAAMLSAFGTVAGLVVTLPVYVVANGAPIGADLTTIIAAMAVMLPFALFLGLPVAVPAAALAGGSLLYWELRRGRRLPGWQWMVAGMMIGVVISLFFGRNDPVWPARIVAALWMGFSGAVGAMIFRRLASRGFR